MSGPNNVHALEHPTRFAPRLLAVPGSEGSFESDRSEFELVPGAKRSPVASGLTTPHSKVQSTNEREDEHERSQVEMLGSGYESTPVSVRSNHGRGPPRTPGNRGISFRNCQVRSVVSRRTCFWAGYCSVANDGLRGVLHCIAGEDPARAALSRYVETGTPLQYCSAPLHREEGLDVSNRQTGGIHTVVAEIQAWQASECVVGA